MIDRSRPPPCTLYTSAAVLPPQVPASHIPGIGHRSTKIKGVIHHSSFRLCNVSTARYIPLRPTSLSIQLSKESRINKPTSPQPLGTGQSLRANYTGRRKHTRPGPLSHENLPDLARRLMLLPVLLLTCFAAVRLLLAPLASQQPRSALGLRPSTGWRTHFVRAWKIR